jgi:hypothetical protein
MTTKILLWSLLAAAVLVAAGFGAWYLIAPPALDDGSAVPQTGAPGAIEGTTFYPSEYNPAQHVCAQSVTDESYERCTDVPEQDGAVEPVFSIKVAPGTYYVYAYLRDPSDVGIDEARRAYWTAFVSCGLTASCTSHEKLEVVVGPGETVRDIRPHDWYMTQ